MNAETSTNAPEAPKRGPGRPKKSAAEVADAAAEPSAAEIAFWQSIQGSDDQADFHDYLERWQEGFYAGLAERRLDRIANGIRQGAPREEPEAEEPEFYAQPVKKKSLVMPTGPIPVIDRSKPLPRYLLLADFFAEDDTLYPADKEIEYLGPPNEHMLALNDEARRHKAEQEEFLDACWAVKCRAEGRPVSPRPLELADQIEAERNLLRADRGVVGDVEMPPTRPDLATNARKNPNAGRVGNVKDGTRYGGRSALQQAPLLGRDGGNYQRNHEPGLAGTNPGPGFGGTKTAA